MTRRALEATRADRRAAGAGAEPALRRDAARRPADVPAALRSAPAESDWARLLSALRGTDEDELPLVGRLPA